jgi:hypothetical protein
VVVIWVRGHAATDTDIHSKRLFDEVRSMFCGGLTCHLPHESADNRFCRTSDEQYPALNCSNGKRQDPYPIVGAQRDRQHDTLLN